MTCIDDNQETRKMASDQREQLSPHICGSKVILFLGAGASAPLGLRLMDSFMDLLEDTMKDAQALTRVMVNMYAGPGRGRDLEMLFETIEEYDSKAQWCRGERNWRGIVATAQFRDLTGDVSQIRKRASDLVITHYARVDRGAVARLYGGFLRAVTEANSPPHLPIFTTNYDTAIEDFVDASEGMFRLVDGFPTGSRRSWEPDTMLHSYVPDPSGRNTLLLFKLHGSSTWRLHKNTREVTKESTAEPVTDASLYENALVWPAQTKSIPKGPYTINYRYLRGCLAQATICVVVGFSFRDEVIRRYFAESVATNKSLRLVIIDPRAEKLIADPLHLEGHSRVKGIVRKFAPDQVTAILNELNIPGI
jgi:hypothetical protein